MFSLFPIGVAHTPFKQAKEIPREGGGPASVEVYPGYEPALLGIGVNSHVWIVGYFPTAERVVVARGRNASADAPCRGVFGMRSPARPNPLGLTPARILGVKGCRLHVDRLDFLDGTPVLDIKPYSPGWDLIPSASSAHRYDPSRYSREELVAALMRTASNALGGSAEGSEVAVAVVDALRALTVEEKLDIRATDLIYEIPALDARVEVLLCATGAAFGNGRLRLASGMRDVVLAACTVDGWRREFRFGDKRGVSS